VPGFPDTRLSLIARLKDPSDQEAWSQFVEIYQPLIHRLARRKGLQDADAEDLTQQVFSAVAQAVDHWQPDRSRARFRTWLQRIAHNLLLNALMRLKPDRASGVEAQRVALDSVAAREGPDSALLRMEYQRQVFRWAARQIHAEFEPATWAAFWATAVEGGEVAAVAEELGKKPGTIYTARSRVMRRLKQKTLEWEESEHAASDLEHDRSSR
jgi:RNA polymerase sigma-70 factor (ECF subfamily)